MTVVAPPNTPPTLTVPANITGVEATSSAGAVVSFTATATDPEDDPDPSPTCTPSSGSTFSVGTTTVNCSVTDSAGASDSDSFSVTVVDTTPPQVTVPASMSVVPSGPAPAGAVVTFTASATDLVSGVLAVTCNPPSGSEFPRNTVTTVTCTSAPDAAGLTGTNSFSISVQDAGAPLVVVPTNRTVEANGPEGSTVNYPAATATDSSDGPLPTQCDPPSGEVFPLGVTTVQCWATDSDGRIGFSSFTVTVEDTTPPTLTPPADTGIRSTVPLPATDPAVVEFLNGGTATDIVDPQPTVTATAPETLPLGTTTITFTAKDDSGNTATATATIEIGPDAAPSGNDRTPPGNVRDVKATTGNRTVSVAWKPPADEDYAGVEITRTPGENGEPSSVVFDGASTRFLDRGLTVGTEYRYVIVALDEAGNRSAGIAVVALARETALLSPQEGAVLKKPPKLTWKKTKGATYYNVQLWSEGKLLSTSAAKKVLSAWPNKPAYQFKKTWKWGGKVRKMKPGTYSVYVWPGFGKKRANNYGDLLFQTTFTIRR